MKRILLPSLLLVITLFSFSVSGQNIKGYKMGSGRVNITPPEPILMSGYANRTTPFTGIHDSIYATALYFTGEKNQALIISADVSGFSASFVDETKKLIKAKTGIPEENILIAACHNHGGPALKTYENITSEATDRYVGSLKQKLVNVAETAAKNPVPFTMGVGKGSCYLNVNRRALLGDGYIGLGRDQQKPCDHDLVVAKFEDLNKKLLAVFINWPCHGTVSGGDNYQITGDWPGAAVRNIKQLVGNDVTVLVTAGASADINPIYGPGVKFNEINTVGFGVARETAKVLESITTMPVKSIQSLATSVTFPGKKSGGSNKPATSYEPGPDVELRISGLKIGDLVLEGISGELMTEMGMQVKTMSPYSNTVIITHCNGASGYICTDAAYPEGGYEPATSKLMPGVEKPLVAKFLEQIHSY